MLSALMAMEHFNDRNPVIVPELANFTDCTIRFDIENSRFFDTGTRTGLAVRSFLQSGETPCAIAGPWNQRPSREITSIAEGAQIPMVAHRGLNGRISRPDESPYSSTTFPNSLTQMQVISEYLFFIGRTNHISFYYSLGDEGSQRAEYFRVTLERKGAKSFFLQSYQGPGSTLIDEERDVKKSLAAVKQRGFRTIVVFMDFPSTDIVAIADAADELEMNKGSYFWVFYSEVDVYVDNENVRKLFRGAAWPGPVERRVLDSENDPFMLEWRNQSQAQIDRLNAANPISEGEPGYVFASPNYTTVTDPDYGVGFLYDAIVSLGMGACATELQLKEAGRNSSSMTGLEHVEGIRSIAFSGASGPLSFGGPGNPFPGGRTYDSNFWVVLNLDPDPQFRIVGEPYAVSFLYPPGGPVIPIGPFQYGDGRMTPPELLRDVPEQNYISESLRVFGLAAMGFTLFFAIMSLAWIAVFRKHRILMAAQPLLLVIMIVGTIMSACSIYTISFDEGAGYSKERLDRLCTTLPWLFTLGQVIVYSALFTKLWRINKVLQFARRTVKISHVAWPMAVFICGTLLILTLWTVQDPLQWERMEIDDLTGESIGECKSDNAIPYIVPLVVSVAIPASLTCLMAWKTSDVDSAYSEGSWIFTLMLVQLEVALISIPTVVTFSNVSTDGSYIGLVILLWIFPLSTLGLIIAPKMSAHYQETKNKQPRSKGTRGKSSGVQVTGLPEKADKRASLRSRLSGESAGRNVSGHSALNSSTSDILVSSNAADVRISQVDLTKPSSNEIIKEGSQQPES